MAANFKVRKMYSAFERTDGSKYPIEIIMVPLKERMNQAILELNILLLTAERITQTIDDCKFSCQNKCSFLRRHMT